VNENGMRSPPARGRWPGEKLCIRSRHQKLWRIHRSTQYCSGTDLSLPGGGGIWPNSRKNYSAKIFNRVTPYEPRRAIAGRTTTLFPAKPHKGHANTTVFPAAGKVLSLFRPSSGLQRLRSVCSITGSLASGTRRYCNTPRHPLPPSLDATAPQHKCFLYCFCTCRSSRIFAIHCRPVESTLRR
jgi:hypothetical protein